MIDNLISWFSRSALICSESAYVLKDSACVLQSSASVSALSACVLTESTCVPTSSIWLHIWDLYAPIASTCCMLYVVTQFSP